MEIRKYNLMMHMHVDVEEWTWKRVMFNSRQLEHDLLTRRMEMERKKIRR